MSKEILKGLLETIRIKTGRSPTDIALDMGYKKNYISEMLTPKGKVTEKFINSFKLKYKNELENPNEDAEKELLRKRIQDLETIVELQKQLLNREKKPLEEEQRRQRS